MNRFFRSITHRTLGAVILMMGLIALPQSATAGTASAPPAKKTSKKLPGSRTHLQNVVFVAFDTETTGFSPTKDRIVEIGAVKFKDGEVIDQKSWLINPGRSIPYWAKRVHGITDEMVEEEPGFEDIYPEFEDFISGSVLMAHNARFDVDFIGEELKRHGLKMPRNEVIDSLPLFRGWYPESKKYSLEGLAQFLKIKGGTFHRALADSMFIYWILDQGLDKRDNLKTLGNLKKAAGGPMKF